MKYTRSSIAVVAVVVCTLALAGCADSRQPSREVAPRPEARPVSAVDCRSEPSSVPQPADGAATPDPEIPTPGRVPAGFEASAALLCTNLGFGGVAGTRRLTAEVVRLEGDLAPLLDALAQADDPVPVDLLCTADFELVPALWLEGGDGTVIPVHYPRNACGKTKQAVRDALEDLETTDVSRLDWPAA